MFFCEFLDTSWWYKWVKILCNVLWQKQENKIKSSLPHFYHYHHRHQSITAPTSTPMITWEDGKSLAQRFLHWYEEMVNNWNKWKCGNDNNEMMLCLVCFFINTLSEYAEALEAHSHRILYQGRPKLAAPHFWEIKKLMNACSAY